MFVLRRWHYGLFYFLSLAAHKSHVHGCSCSAPVKFINQSPAASPPPPVHSGGIPTGFTASPRTVRSAAGIRMLIPSLRGNISVIQVRRLRKPSCTTGCIPSQLLSTVRLCLHTHVHSVTCVCAVYLCCMHAHVSLSPKNMIMKINMKQKTGSKARTINKR